MNRFNFHYIRYWTASYVLFLPKGNVMDANLFLLAHSLIRDHGRHNALVDFEFSERPNRGLRQLAVRVTIAAAGLIVIFATLSVA